MPNKLALKISNWIKDPSPKLAFVILWMISVALVAFLAWVLMLLLGAGHNADPHIPNINYIGSIWVLVIASLIGLYVTFTGGVSK